ncbi:MAG: adenosylcobinamide-GDP ribazoletransferase [Rhodospirillales bacterium]|nr:adenosylcobinamide-GDP ribazoletransferase [Rhodospirillales bacterium]
MVGGWWRDICLAGQFLTRLPFPVPAGEFRNLGESARAFPLVGLLIGALAALGHAVVLALGAPALVAAFLAIALAAALTGGLHEDGLADAADGLGAGVARDEKLALMRAGGIGAFGVLAVVLSVGIRAAAIASLAGAAGALVAAHACSRGILPWLMHAREPARADGLAVAAGRPDRRSAAVAFAVGCGIALVALGPVAGLGAILLASGASWCITRLADRQLGGITGDVLGAVQQASEIAILVAAAAWAA